MAFLGFEDDLTPTVVDPCTACGDELIRVKDNVVPPMSEQDADERRRCEASRGLGFRYCARLRTVDLHIQL